MVCILQYPSLLSETYCYEKSNLLRYIYHQFFSEAHWRALRVNCKNIGKTQWPCCCKIVYGYYMECEREKKNLLFRDARHYYKNLSRKKKKRKNIFKDSVTCAAGLGYTAHTEHTHTRTHCYPHMEAHIAAASARQFWLYHPRSEIKCRAKMCASVVGYTSRSSKSWSGTRKKGEWLDTVVFAYHLKGMEILWRDRANSVLLVSLCQWSN